MFGVLLGFGCIVCALLFAFPFDVLLACWVGAIVCLLVGGGVGLRLQFALLLGGPIVAGVGNLEVVLVCV